MYMYAQRWIGSIELRIQLSRSNTQLMELILGHLTGTE